MRETSGYLYLSLYLQCPEEYTTLTKTLFMERTILQLIAAEINAVFEEKDRIYLIASKGRVSSFIQKSAAFKNYFQFSVKHFELEVL